MTCWWTSRNVTRPYAWIPPGYSFGKAASTWTGRHPDVASLWMTFARAGPRAVEALPAWPGKRAACCHSLGRQLPIPAAPGARPPAHFPRQFPEPFFQGFPSVGPDQLHLSRTQNRAGGMIFPLPLLAPPPAAAKPSSRCGRAGASTPAPPPRLRSSATPPLPVRRTEPGSLARRVTRGRLSCLTELCRENSG